jgi:pyruvate dehydrogenase E2 component (dihydrolipoamide acetyltransferase)
MEAGTVYDWRVKPGDHVKRGDIVATVETDKGTIDVEVFEDGVVEQILIEPGTRVLVGATLAVIRSEAAASAEELQPVDQLRPVRPSPVEAPAGNGQRIRVSPAARKRAAELAVDVSMVKGSGPDGAITLEDIERATTAEKAQVRVSPVARRMAEGMGVDLSTVKGSGPRGAVSRADVEQAAAERPTAQEPAVTAVSQAPPIEPRPQKTQADFQAGMRRAIAAAMARSNRDIPHYYLETRIDMNRPLRWLETENLKRSLQERILPVVLFIKATAKALGDVPELNAYWLDDQLQPQEAIHVGFAVALRQGGLVTPAIHHADLKGLDELMVAMRDVITRTRSGRLRGSDLTDATITLTNLGDRGVEKVFGVIYPPQVALVGLGKVTEQPWAENGLLGVRPVVTVTLAGDHRATDGHRGGQFLDALNKYLQEPETL